MYMALKHSHVGFVYLSLLLFLLRFALAFLKPALNNHKLLNVAPHVISTLLLITAGMLCVQLEQYPFTEGWVTAKLLGLIAYVVLGVVAMKKRDVKMFALSLLTFCYVFGVAKSHSALSWLAMMS